MFGLTKINSEITWREASIQSLRISDMWEQEKIFYQNWKYI